MKLINEDIWGYHLDYICITTNSNLKSNGELVAGRGIALEAKQRYPDFPKFIGRYLKNYSLVDNIYGIIVYKNLIAFQTKIHWRNDSVLDVIQQSTDMLTEFANKNKDKLIGLPFPGVNNGNLSKSVVIPIIESLPDNVLVFYK